MDGWLPIVGVSGKKYRQGSGASAGEAATGKQVQCSEKREISTGTIHQRSGTKRKRSTMIKNESIKDHADGIDLLRRIQAQSPPVKRPEPKKLDQFKEPERAGSVHRYFLPQP